MCCTMLRLVLHYPFNGSGLLEGFKEALDKSNAEAEAMKQALQHSQTFVESMRCSYLGLSIRIARFKGEGAGRRGGSLGELSLWVW